jgi:hypothetical protein
LIAASMVRNAYPLPAKRQGQILPAAIGGFTAGRLLS